MRIVIADDHPLFREAVRLRIERLFEGSEVREASSLDELLALADAAPAPDLVLVDLRMPGMHGAGDIARIRQSFASVPVALMSGLAGAHDVRVAIEAGAGGFLPKTMPPEHFGAALNVLLAGGTYLPTDILQAARADGEREGARSTLNLTARERQVLVELATGASNKEIGRHLDLAEVTVKLHVRQILKKVGARNRAEAATVAVREGLI
jgi:two-component system, NarL family, nitrate/nitrite response regulator NarL